MKTEPKEIPIITENMLITFQHGDCCYLLSLGHINMDNELLGGSKKLCVSNVWSRFQRSFKICLCASLHLRV